MPTYRGPRERNIDPDVAMARSRLSTAHRCREPEEVIADLKRQLEEAKTVAAARQLAERIPELPPDKRAQVAAMFGGAE